MLATYHQDQSASLSMSPFELFAGNSGFDLEIRELATPAPPTSEIERRKILESLESECYELALAGKVVSGERPFINTPLTFLCKKISRELNVSYDVVVEIINRDYSSILPGLPDLDVTKVGSGLRVSLRK